MAAVYFLLARSVPPSGGSLEIGNVRNELQKVWRILVPPSGGSLEIGNGRRVYCAVSNKLLFPLRGDP